MQKNKFIGITSSVPIEIIFAAGKIPADLNNIFINSKDPVSSLTLAERNGYPDTCCAWIKGIYTVALEDPRIGSIVGVAEGDCSNAVALLETLQLKKKKILSFSYPKNHSIIDLEIELKRFANALGAKDQDIVYWKKRLDRIRKNLRILDSLTYKSGQVSGEENHLWLVGASDMNSDPDDFERRLEEFLVEASLRSHQPQKLRLGYIGVPPITKDVYREFAKHGAGIVLNEVQRQFAMIDPSRTLAQQYYNFTYPYSIFERIRDIKKQIKLRRIDGIVHYTQAFCHRAIQDIVLRENLGVPILRIEGNDHLYLNSKQKTQIEAFCDMFEKQTG